MEVPLLDVRSQLESIEAEAKEAVGEVIESAQYALGPKVEALEKAIADYLGVKFAIGVSSGSDALLISLMAFDIGPGDIVVTTPFSFFATAGAIARLNATPAFVDIEPDTYNMDPEALRTWFEKEPDKRDKVKAIIPIHLHGQCAGMDPILEVAAEFNVPVVEDATQAFGAQYPSETGLKRAGSMGFFGCFSFYPSKNLGGIGDGGMVVTSDAETAEKVRKLRNHGADPEQYYTLVGGNFRLDAIQAAVLLVKLKHVEKWNAMRRENAAYYDENLNVPGISKPIFAYDRAHHVYNQYVVSVAERRDDLRAFLKANGVESEVYYPVPVHQQECFQYLGYAPGAFPNSEYAAAHSLAIPIYPELTTEMQDYVIERLAGFYD